MPRASVIAKTYAKALFSAAKKGENFEKISSELEIFKKNFSASFAQELKNPVISRNDLTKIIDEVSKKFSFGKLTTNFFASVVKNRRLHLFPEIYEEFFRLIRIQKNILEAELISAARLERNEIEKVKSLMEKKFPNKQIAIKETIREENLGGFQLKIGSQIIDMSLKNQLSKLSKELVLTIN